jgi:hypothetical protein
MGNAIIFPDPLNPQIEHFILATLVEELSMNPLQRT